MTDITINQDQRLYVIPCGDGYSTLGFEFADQRARAVAAWLVTEGRGTTIADHLAPLQPLRLAAMPGTIEHYRHYQAIMDAGREYNKQTGKRCDAELHPLLVGLENHRVEITAPGAETSRFWVGKSTGWLPCHLQIARRNSSGGFPVHIPPMAQVRVVRSDRR